MIMGSKISTLGRKGNVLNSLKGSVFPLKKIEDVGFLYYPEKKKLCN